mmetsp:Transcript_26463/g.4605  ORF Transcript_26463/g.4605 Transcript_26463/m.4605 type:complete len:158 (-) Transcript_26463:756-1229(-)
MFAHIPTGETECECKEFAKYNPHENECMLYKKECDKPNMYLDSGEDGEHCKPCHPDCAMCAGPDDDECIVCHGGAKLVKDSREDKTGICECEDDEFLSIEGCKMCNPLCDGCFGEGADKCIRCAPGLIRRSDNSCGCPQGQKYFDGTCAGATCINFF